MTDEERIRRRKNGLTYYYRHREKIAARHKAYMEPRFAWLKEYKETRPCVDCKNKFPAECMDFDHLPGKKKFRPIAHLLHCRDESVLQAEIEKCELVCANCHRIRTFARVRARRALKGK